MAIKALIGMAEADLTSVGGRPALHLIALAEMMRAGGAEVSVALDSAVFATPVGRAAVGLVAVTCPGAEVVHFDSGRTFRGVSRDLVQAARFADFLQAQESERRWDWCITTGLGGLAYFAARSRLQGLALDSTRFAVGGFTLGQARIPDALAQFGSRLNIDTLVVEEAMGEAVDLVVTGPPLRFKGTPSLRLDEDSRNVLEQAELVYLVDPGDPALLRLVLEARDRVREGLGRDPQDLLLLADSPFASPSEDAEAMKADAAERNSTSPPPRTLVLGSHLLSTALSGLSAPVVARPDIVPGEQLIRVCTGDEVARRLDGTATVGDFNGVVEAFPEALEREILRMLSGTAPVEEFKNGGDIPVIRGERPAQAEESWMEVLAAKQRSQPREGHDAKDPLPLVSVCIAHRDDSEHLEEMLNSLSLQDYPHLEVVVVDDGSHDPHSRRRLGELENKSFGVGVKVLRRPHRYKGAARNAAAEAASGEYFFFMDSDNLAKSREVSTFVAAAVRTGCDIVTCNLGGWDGALLEKDPDQPARDVVVLLGLDGATGLLKNQLGDTNCMVRREAFKALGGFDHTYGARLEDWDFHFRAKLAGLRTEVIFDPLFWYRHNPAKGHLYAQESRIALAKRLRSLLETDAGGLGRWQFPALAAVYADRWEELVYDVYGLCDALDGPPVSRMESQAALDRARAESDQLRRSLEAIEKSRTYRLAAAMARVARFFRR
ncbi:MAG: glycosyltransferase family A protein [Actinomycetota bacterium]|nr:glycosyltransferase family A protein [Actinomycetota bacterium]